MFRVALGLILPTSASAKGRPVGLTHAYVNLLFLQILLGGFVAGLNAGLVSDTWPLMLGQVIPDGLFYNDPWYMNMLDNPLTIHFEHRLMAYIVAIIAMGLWWEMHSDGNATVRRAAYLVLLSVIVQIALGVLTIVNMVPIQLAAAHQAGAVVALSAGLYLLNRVKA